MSPGLRWIRLAAILPAAFLAAACGSDDPKPSETHPGAAILSLEARPEVVAKAGDTATISWKTKNATSVELRRNDEALPLGDASAADGSVDVVIDGP